MQYLPNIEFGLKLAATQRDVAARRSEFPFKTVHVCNYFKFKGITDKAGLVEAINFLRYTPPTPGVLLSSLL
jgi:hypothetical protein